jgi:hypothetical protein
MEDELGMTTRTGLAMQRGGSTKKLSGLRRRGVEKVTRFCIRRRLSGCPSENSRCFFLLKSL